MLFHLLAEAVALFHAAFVAFVVLGGLLALRWRRVMWIHLPAAAWGVLIEFTHWVCPLTPLENTLRARAGVAGYSGGFVDHYILRALYPNGLTPTIQLCLGVAVIAVNVAVYAWLWHRRSRRRTSRSDRA